MTASSVDIADMLEAESSLGLALATDLFIGREPTKPDECVTIFDTSSIPPQLAFTDQGYEYPSVQIRVRSRVYQTGWAMIEAIKNSLHGRAQETWNGTLYSVVYCASGPVFLDWDENSRARFVVNINIQRR